jgi:hypothetical protein
MPPSGLESASMAAVGSCLRTENSLQRIPNGANPPLWNYRERHYGVEHLSIQTRVQSHFIRPGSSFNNPSSFCIASFIYQWLYSHLLGRSRFSVSWSYIQPAGILGRRISPSQVRYLHAGQCINRINTYRHSYLEWDSNPRPQCLSGQRQFIP